MRECANGENQGDFLCTLISQSVAIEHKNYFLLGRCLNCLLCNRNIFLQIQMGICTCRSFEDGDSLHFGSLFSPSDIDLKSLSIEGHNTSYFKWLLIFWINFRSSSYLLFFAEWISDFFGTVGHLNQFAVGREIFEEKNYYVLRASMVFCFWRKKDFSFQWPFTGPCGSDSLLWFLLFWRQRTQAIVVFVNQQNVQEGRSSATAHGLLVQRVSGNHRWLFVYWKPKKTKHFEVKRRAETVALFSDRFLNAWCQK